MPKRLMTPTFLGIGPYKTATTWLHRCLEAHPAVYVPFKKELHYFSFYYDRGWDWYKEQFGKNGQHRKAVGEISPSYFSHLKAPIRIFEKLPDIKFVVILRNPIDRAYSHYCMDLRLGKVKAEIETEIDQFVDFGLYHKHLSRYFPFFSKDQFLWLVYDDIKTNPALSIKQVYKFLEVDEDFIPLGFRKRYYARRRLPKNRGIYNFFYRIERSFLEHSSLGHYLVRIAARTGFTNVVHRILPDRDYPELTKDISKRLAKIYRSDVESLSNLIHRNLLMEWLQPYMD